MGEHEDTRCGFCMEKLITSTDPKKLPCSHVYCLSCLTADYKKTCPICNQQWTGEADSLQSYSLAAETNCQEEDAIICDPCKSSESPASVYCVNCAKTFCEVHEQDHDELFDLEHDKVSISTYASSRVSYQRLLCKEHPNQVITIACGLCYQMFCANCDMDSLCQGEEEGEAVYQYGPSKL
ncbi:transcription intermediary factor 1-beta-like [Watersipora subatra]|uniref:transcription intermediary factor 1-beta-like n=1 Tax=Watersipora subatra TaxID=2589382 RepID=UPI00355C59D7